MPGSAIQYTGERRKIITSGFRDGRRCRSGSVHLPGGGIAPILHLVVAGAAAREPRWRPAIGQEYQVLYRTKPVPGRVLAALVGLALSGLAPSGLPWPVRGAAVCRMACAGTSHCCCRRPASPAPARAVHGSGTSLRPASVTSTCPPGCAAVVVSVAVPFGPPARDRAGIVPPAPDGTLVAAFRALPEVTRLARATRPRAPPSPRSRV
jgi:hypothetical protein